MTEYIDKAELLRSLERKIKADNERRMAVVDTDFIDLVNDATVIEDVEEVVRCRNCCWCIVTSPPYASACCIKGMKSIVVEADDFCSFGERKE